MKGQGFSNLLAKLAKYSAKCIESRQSSSEENSGVLNQKVWPSMQWDSRATKQHSCKLPKFLNDLFFLFFDYFFFYIFYIAFVSVHLPDSQLTREVNFFHTLFSIEAYLFIAYKMDLKYSENTT